MNKSTAEDDVFNDDGEELDYRTFNKVTHDCYIKGYHDGLDAGQETKMQQGKDDGYKIGLQAALKIGKLEGKLKAVVCYVKFSQLTIEDDDLKYLHEVEESLIKLQHKLKSSVIPESKSYEDLLKHFDNILDVDLKSIIDRCKVVFKKLNVDESILDS